MLKTNVLSAIFPKKLLWRLTLINVLIIGFFIIISGFAVYNTACFLVNDLGKLQPVNQSIFNATLFQYLVIFSVAAVIVGSIIHLCVTKIVIRPLQKLIDSTLSMKLGEYPEPIEVNSTDEIGQLIKNFNELVILLEKNELHRKDLIADLSHELRTPLANLNGYLSALKNGVIEGDKELYIALHGELERITSMMEQLDQLEEWNNIKDKKLMNKQTFSLAELVNETLNLFALVLQERGIEIEVNLADELVKGSSEDIMQVLRNLIDNAIRYYKGTAPIQIKGEVVNKEYRLSIIGEGQTISEEDTKQIFERFYRVDASRSRDSGGSGLGLAISKEIITSHQGKIGLISKDNMHTFWFTIPIA